MATEGILWILCLVQVGSYTLEYVVFSIFQPAAFVKDFKSIFQPFAKVFVNIFQLYFYFWQKYVFTLSLSQIIRVGALPNPSQSPMVTDDEDLTDEGW